MRIPDEEIQARLPHFPGWKLNGRELVKTFKFDDFSQALDFVVHVGQAADEQDHHPDIDIRFDRVRLVLTTHDEDGVTEADFKLAKDIEALSPGP